MSLSVGIVGLPNVGKSTFFNAITNAGAQAQNYPFCTIEPNTGMVPIPDPRLDELARISQSEKIVPAMITFTDIAGLVKGASQGEGLGNKFLSHIRAVSVVAHVVRCFEDANITHVAGKIDPLEDIETIHTELVLADFESAEKQCANAEKQAKKTKSPEDAARLALLQKMVAHLSSGKPLRSLPLVNEEAQLLQHMDFLTAKKMIYIANVDEAGLQDPNPLAERVATYAQAQGEEFAKICARAEEEITQLPAMERLEFLATLGIPELGLDVVAKKCFRLLGLQTFLTSGPKETRAWTIPIGCTAPQAAGAIHSDFERGFIRANIVRYEDFIRLGGVRYAREKGLLRQEGREYVMQDGDVVEFLFNT